MLTTEEYREKLNAPFLLRNINRYFKNNTDPTLIVRLVGLQFDAATDAPRIVYMMESAPDVHFVTPVTSFRTNFTRIKQVAAVEDDPDTAA